MRKRLALIVGPLVGVALLGSVLLSGCGSAASTASTTSVAGASGAGTATSTQAASTQAGGAPPAAPPGGSGSAGGGGSAAITLTSAAYKVSGQTATKTDQTISATAADQSGVLVTDNGSLTLSGSKITTSGDSSSLDNSSFYGLNAAVVATGGSTIDLSNSSVTSTGTGANGVFATGTGASVTLSDVKIDCTAQGAHGVDATLGGKLTLTNVDIITRGANSAALATDRGSGTVTATGGTIETTGQDSPGIYSTGDITVSGATITSTGAEAAVIEGGNSITLTNTTLSSSKADKQGVMIYQSMSGDAAGTKGTFTMTGGSLSYTSSTGPLFYVNNSTGVITLKGVTVTAASGTLVKAAAGKWGTSGSNGGTVLLTADGQTLTGDMVADNISSITSTLQNGSVLTGAINTDKAAKAANLTLDSSSTWNVTADSYLTTLTDTGGISGTAITNIHGNGHTVYYDASNSANSALGGKTFTLAGGGELKPMS